MNKKSEVKIELEYKLLNKIRDRKKINREIEDLRSDISKINRSNMTYKQLSSIKSFNENRKKVNDENRLKKEVVENIEKSDEIKNKTNVRSNK